MTINVLIVEDEVNLARFLQLEFEHEEYRVTVAHEGRKGLDLALQGAWDVIILDIMLPDISGLEVCRRIRAESQVPIIMLTARDTVPDRVGGLDAGADDYLVKPFAIEELFARIRALMRRRREESSPEDIVTVRSCTLYAEQRRLVCNDQEVKLTAREFDLLSYLMHNRDRVLNRQTILEKVWGFDYTGDTNVVDVYIRYLRHKLSEAGVQDLIETVRGVGYVIRQNTHAD
ncbi:DNA-binding response regulator [Marinithermofilum abyssi]|uniref:DNA-binding response regulator n=1 Tax=Marinithermofilum abyssi TaxID=1571185 RepID=A0A8J2VJ58_9BACL|nr:response regulator transcription factor [Marinithermofilum abyssi]GGE27049.1 DNA-binding response regulator [Marinithermofilum abyssi]